MASMYALLSEAQRHTVSKCPKCGGRDIRGPHDTALSAMFLFTRAYFCRTYWWDKEIRMKDDIEEAKAKEAKRLARLAADRERKGRVA